MPTQGSFFSEKLLIYKLLQSHQELQGGNQDYDPHSQHERKVFEIYQHYREIIEESQITESKKKQILEIISSRASMADRAMDIAQIHDTLNAELKDFYQKCTKEYLSNLQKELHFATAEFTKKKPAKYQSQNQTKDFENNLSSTFAVAKITGLIEWPETLNTVDDLNQIIDSNSSRTEIFQLKEKENIFIINFENLEAQKRTLGRISMMTENPLFRDGKVPSHDDVMKHNGVGHDLQAKDIAKFFNVINNPGEQEVSIWMSEKNFLYFCLEKKIIEIKTENKDVFVPCDPPKVVLSLSEEEARLDLKGNLFLNTTTEGRKNILRHELSHGEYFTNPEYQSYCQSFWQENLNEAERESWRNYLKKNQYDESNKDLMINEMQAHLVHSGPWEFFTSSKLAHYGLSKERFEDLYQEFVSGLKKKNQLHWIKFSLPKKNTPPHH